MKLVGQFLENIKYFDNVLFKMLAIISFINLLFFCNFKILYRLCRALSIASAQDIFSFKEDFEKKLQIKLG